TCPPDHFGFLGSYYWHDPGDGPGLARFTMRLAPGDYQVFTTWVAAPRNSAHASYIVLGGNPLPGGGPGAGGRRQVLLNQKRSPGRCRGRVHWAGQPWASLGVYHTSGGAVSVLLDTPFDGTVIANAVFAVPVTMQRRFGASTDASTVATGQNMVYALAPLD